MLELAASSVVTAFKGYLRRRFLYYEYLSIRLVNMHII